MEANLNQFRLLTVDGEQKANAMRKGPTPAGGKSCDIFNRQRSDGCGGEVLESPTPRYNDEGVNNNPTGSSSRSATPTPTPSDGHADPTSPDPVNNNCVSPSVQSVDTGYALSPTEKDISDLGMQTGCTTTDRKPGLVGAIESLEKTIQWHCQLLNRKKDRGPITKSPSADSTTCRVPVNSIHPKTSVRTDKVLVYVRVVFLKIGEIDTMKENFMADAFVQARWREPALDGQQAQFQSVQNIDDIEWDKFWNPKLYVENNLGEPKETIWQTLSFNTKGDATVYERRRIKGCFLENLELDEFPFDTQDLTLTITSERAENELELEEDASEISSINVQSFVDEQEWELHSHVETWKRITTKIYQNSKFKHPSFSTSCRASRRPGFFIWNIFLVMLFICSLTFATFSVELTKPENRLQLSFILLLTTITFKFVVSQTLPRISYLTYLDKYILTSMAILCGVCVWHAVIPLFKYDIELAKKIDKWGIIISGSSYFLFHIFFFLYIYIVALKKRWKYDQKDKDHKERVKKLQTLLEQGHNAETRTELPV